jgi:hypothetical protein
MKSGQVLAAANGPDVRILRRVMASLASRPTATSGANAITATMLLTNRVGYPVYRGTCECGEPKPRTNHLLAACTNRMPLYTHRHHAVVRLVQTWLRGLDMHAVLPAEAVGAAQRGAAAIAYEVHTETWPAGLGDAARRIGRAIRAERNDAVAHYRPDNVVAAVWRETGTYQLGVLLAAFDVTVVLEERAAVAHTAKLRRYGELLGRMQHETIQWARARANWHSPSTPVRYVPLVVPIVLGARGTVSSASREAIRHFTAGPPPGVLVQWLRVVVDWSKRVCQFGDSLSAVRVAAHVVRDTE